jgi:aspartate/methionine/tyrosine aminotransferase
MGESMARIVPHHRDVRIPDFALERYFAEWEFNVEHVLCASDVEGFPMSELIALADTETRALWKGLRLGYTESTGHPLLRREIAATYESIEPDDVLTFAGAEEAIFCLMNVAVGPGDHVIVTWPGYQSLYEVARATGADITLHGLHESDGWAVDLDRLKSEVRPTTKLIVVNTPHSPTGMMLDRTTYDGLIEIAEEGGIRLFMDEVYRGLEYDETDRLAAGADALPDGISLGVMSKAYAMAGLRIGWIATHDRDLLARLAAFKDYTTICSSGPSEILAIIALRARERVLERSRGIIAANLELVDGFFEDYLDRFTWIRPSAGSVGFPRLTVPGVAIDDWAAELVKAEGVLILPGSVFGYAGNHFRLGLGRTDLPDALARLEKFASKTLR